MRSSHVATVLLGILLTWARVASAADAVGNAPTPEPADRIFGVVPNYATVEPTEDATPVHLRERFRLATLSSFDPFIYPWVGVMSSLNSGGSVAAYRAGYARMFTDNAVGNYFTMAILPSVFHQDPRYFALGRGTALHRALYALSRSVVTRTSSGGLTFNVSEIAGNGTAAALSNLYYGPADRTVSGTMNRWAAQVMSDTLGNELKEFWPDIRRKLHRQ